MKAVFVNVGEWENATVCVDIACGGAVVRWRGGAVALWRGGSVARWFGYRTLNLENTVSNHLRVVIAAWLNASKKSSWRWSKKVCQG